MNGNTKCIYCLRDSGVTFKGVEHVIPQAFGKFGSRTPTLNCVCDECNGYFGRNLDQLLSRKTLEGVSRYTRGLASKETRPQRRLEIALAEGPETGNFAGMRFAVDGKTGKLMKPLAQFHAFNFKTGKTEVYFKEQIPGLALPEDVYGKPGKDGVKGTWKVQTMAASKQEHDELVEVLRAAGIDYQAGEGFSLPAAEAPEGSEPDFPVEITGVVDTEHKRALAKILMNFIAWALGPQEALKSRWDFLRSYILRGDGAIKARITEAPFWDGQETKTRRFADDSIDLRIENLKGGIVGSIQFYGHFTYQMVLAENDALEAAEEIGRRFTPGSEPIPGEKRAIEAVSKGC
jgi:hypothetical protein